MRTLDEAREEDLPSRDEILAFIARDRDAERTSRWRRGQTLSRPR
ncbi:MAG: hypothetical protein ACRECZ_03515 [Methylocella sp.]